MHDEVWSIHEQKLQNTKQMSDDNWVSGMFMGFNNIM